MRLKWRGVPAFLAFSRDDVGLPVIGPMFKGQRLHWNASQILSNLLVLLTSRVIEGLKYRSLL